MTSLVLLTIAFYLWHVFGVTIGYHRLLSHRSFRCPKFVEYFFVLGAYLSFHGSPIWWVTMHRAHHRHSDTPLDPHTPHKGVKLSYAFWLVGQYEPHIDPRVQSADLLADPLYKFLEQDPWSKPSSQRSNAWDDGYFLDLVVCFLWRIFLWKCFGWQIALCSVIAGFVALNVPLWLNVVCHIPRFGYKSATTDDDSVNCWWMAILALGDGWHNNHHAHPGSYTNWIQWFEVDPSYAVIKALSWVGLADLTPGRKDPVKVAITPEPVLMAPGSSKSK